MDIPADLWRPSPSHIYINNGRISGANPGSSRNGSAERALWAIILLNLPAPLAQLYIQARILKDAQDTYTHSLSKQVLAFFVPSWDEQLRQQHISNYVRDHAPAAMKQFNRQWMLSEFSLRRDKLHTFLTSNFVHASTQHLAGNMISLWGLGSVCCTLPRMNAWHMMAITLGASFCGSLATFYTMSRQILLLPMVRVDFLSCGASGVVCAFGAVAALGAPNENLSFLGFDMRTSTFIACQLGADVLGFLMPQRQRMASRSGVVQESLTGHVAHLAGALFGAAYYILFLRARRSSPGSRAASLDHEVAMA